MKQYLLSQRSKHKYIMIICDTIVVVAGVLLSYAFRIYANQHDFTFNMVAEKLHPLHVVIVPAHLFTLYVYDLYNMDRLVNTVRSSLLIVISVLSAGMIIAGVFFFIPGYIFGRQVMLIHLPVLSLLLVLWRLMFLRFFSIVSKPKRLGLVCDENTAKTFMHELSTIDFSGVEVSHVCCKESKGYFKNGKIEVCASLSELLNDNDFDVLVFDSSKETFSNEEIRLILETRQKDKGVYEISSLLTSLTGKVPLDLVDGKWMMNSRGLQGMVSKPYIHMKRLFDIVASFLMLILLSPFILVIACAVKMETKGKAIFSQERLGRHRRPFICYKFRTMMENAEEQTGPVWSSDDDQRITRLGRILRKTRLDELPQLWNIVKGDISFVGPRPIRKYFADMLSRQIPFYELRFSVQPGLSGWAQVNHDYAGSEDGQLEKFKYELFYIQNMSLFLDIIVVFKTLKSFLKIGGK